MGEITFIGTEGYETYVIDKEKMIIGVRPKWISVKERLPDVSGWYLGYIYHGLPSNDTVIVAQVQFDRNLMWIPFAKEFSYKFEVTHWMPLPEKPEEP